MSAPLFSEKIHEICVESLDRIDYKYIIAVTNTIAVLLALETRKLEDEVVTKFLVSMAFLVDADPAGFARDIEKVTMRIGEHSHILGANRA